MKGTMGMRRSYRVLRVGWLFLLCGLLITNCTPSRPSQEHIRPALLEPSRSLTPPPAATKVHLQENYGRLPLSFELNTGQTAEEVEFLARGKGYTLFLSGAEATLALRKPGQKTRPSLPGERIRGQRPEPEPVAYDVLTMQLVSANPNPPAQGQDQLPGIVNYFIGNDPDKWRTNIPTYAKVAYHEVYPGIDLVYYGNQRNLEYDFIVAPGANPGQIRLAFEGATQVKQGTAGTLLVQTADSEVRLQKPLVYQEIDGDKRSVACRYVLLPGEGQPEGNPQIGFQLALYDTSQPLIIDPVLAYSTFLGGSSGEFSGGIAVDGGGAAYLTGTTDSPDFPTVNPVQGTVGGGCGCVCG
jgi:hypothetical protein